MLSSLTSDVDSCSKLDNDSSFVEELHTICIKRIGVSISNSSCTRQCSGRSISVTVILGSRAVYTRSMSHFVQGGRGLVLSVAGCRQSRKCTVVDWAVHDDVLRWNCVSKNVRFAISYEKVILTIALLLRDSSKLQKWGTCRKHQCNSSLLALRWLSHILVQRPRNEQQQLNE